MPLKDPSAYLFHLKAMTSSDAKRMWRAAIKEAWNNQCVYCGATEHLTLDHVQPKARGVTTPPTTLYVLAFRVIKVKAHPIGLAGG